MRIVLKIKSLIEKCLSSKSSRELPITKDSKPNSEEEERERLITMPEKE